MMRTGSEVVINIGEQLGSLARKEVFVSATREHAGMETFLHRIPEMNSDSSAVMGCGVHKVDRGEAGSALGRGIAEDVSQALQFLRQSASFTDEETLARMALMVCDQLGRVYGGN